MRVQRRVSGSSTKDMPPRVKGAAAPLAPVADSRHLQIGPSGPSHPVDHMTSVALRPRSASEIVDAAFQILRAHYAQFVMCSALAYLPWLVMQLVIASDPGMAARANLWIGAVLGVGIWLVFALMSAVIIVCASQAYLGDPVDVGIAVRRALPRLP